MTPTGPRPHRRRTRSLAWWRSTLPLVALLLVALFARQAMASDAARYVDLYGLADPAAHPDVRRAERMFDRLRRLAGPEAREARLLVIDSESRPWAIALPDDSVVLSRGALEIVYRDADRERGDAELAFVLGHELAHLTTRDLWHQLVYASLADGADDDAALAALESALAGASLDLAAWRDRELRADELGFVLASLGGYAVERLLGADIGAGLDGASGFLSVWVEQTRAEGSATHYAARTRSAFLRQRLRETAQHVRTFDTGVVLAHFGRHADALRFFRAFQRRYPSAEVLSNLGYVQLQLAREAMPDRLAYRFWLPTLLETGSGLRQPTRGLAEGLPPAARSLLERAEASLDAAVRANERDTLARLNLAVAHWYLGEIHHARAIVEDALERRPDDVQLQALRALVLLEQDPEVDMAPRSIAVLETLAAPADAPANVLFNLMRVLAERRRDARAAVVRERLLLRLDELPTAFAREVCAEVGAEPRCARLADRQARTGGALDALFPVRPGARLQDVLERSPSVIRAWERRQVDGLDVVHLDVDGGYLVALGDTIEIAVARPVGWVSDTLVAAFGEPRVTLPSGGGSIATFAGGVSARVVASTVEEIWLGR